MNAKVVWIGIRPERKAAVEPQSSVYADNERGGLTGDHNTRPHRQVTIISKEALDKVAQRLNIPYADPALTRRNILISGLNFDLKEGTVLQIGNAVLEVTGPCFPCERMEQNFGTGGRVAMADAGGLTARIMVSGSINIGDAVDVVSQPVAAGSVI
jgi:MOSC domain-containing protein YiiM